MLISREGVLSRIFQKYNLKNINFYMNPYFNYFREKTLLTILIALKPLCKDLQEEIIDIIRIKITLTGDFYEFEYKDFIDNKFY